MTTAELIRKAKEVRTHILSMLAEAESGHLGGALGLADIFTVLYFNELNIYPKNPYRLERDRLVLSIGHVAPVLYATLALRGFFKVEALQTLRKLGTQLQGHASTLVSGVEVSTGSLGQGLSIAVGMAITAKTDRLPWRVYSIHGDGELQEGQIWEAAMSAAKFKLNNLMAIIDRNGLQIDGSTETVMPIEPLKDKWLAFGWNVLETDGNDIKAILQVFNRAKTCKDKPTVIIAYTKMGKGVKSIENDFHWHGKPPTKEQLPDFLKELNQNDI